MRRTTPEYDNGTGLKDHMRTVRKYCPACMEHGVKTSVERYRNADLNYCTYHYWLMGGKSRGRISMTLGDYAEASRRHFFVTSVPSPEDVRKLRPIK
jgi:hypothetical protein